VSFSVTYLALREAVVALRVALAVSLALATSCYISDTIGSLLPVLLAKLRVDPTTASAPLITTIADITTVTVYFTIATLLL